MASTTETTTSKMTKLPDMDASMEIPTNTLVPAPTTTRHASSTERPPGRNQPWEPASNSGGGRKDQKLDQSSESREGMQDQTQKDTRQKKQVRWNDDSIENTTTVPRSDYALMAVQATNDDERKQKDKTTKKTKTSNAITSTNDEFAFLGNDYPVFITFDGDPYLTVEHALIAARLPRGDRTPYVCNANQALSVAQAQKLFSRSAVASEEWDKERENATLEGLLQQKFTLNQDLMTQLLDTHPRMLNLGDAKGENRLGKALMSIRRQIKDSKANKSDVKDDASSPPNVSFKTGSVLEANEQFMAHICNCVSADTRSGTLEKRVFDKWPHANVYRLKHAQGSTSTPGTISKYGNASNQEEERGVIDMHAQRYPGVNDFPNDSPNKRAEWFQQCLEQIADSANKDIKSIAFSANFEQKDDATRERYKEMVLQLALRRPTLQIAIYEYTPEHQKVPDDILGNQDSVQGNDALCTSRHQQFLVSDSCVSQPTIVCGHRSISCSLQNEGGNANCREFPSCTVCGAAQTPFHYGNGTAYCSTLCYEHDIRDRCGEQGKSYMKESPTPKITPANITTKDLDLETDKTTSLGNAGILMNLAQSSLARAQNAFKTVWSLLDRFTANHELNDATKTDTTLRKWLTDEETATTSKELTTNGRGQEEVTTTQTRRSSTNIKQESRNSTGVGLTLLMLLATPTMAITSPKQWIQNVPPEAWNNPYSYVDVTPQFSMRETTATNHYATHDVHSYLQGSVNISNPPTDWDMELELDKTVQNMRCVIMMESSDNETDYYNTLYALSDDDDKRNIDERRKKTVHDGNISFSSATATVGIISQGKQHELITTIDAGAARTGLSAPWVRQHAPDIWANRVASTKRFHSLTGDALDCKWQVSMQIAVGDVKGTITAYLFENMATTFLLGSNSLTRLGLNLNFAEACLEHKSKMCTRLARTRREREHLKAPYDVWMEVCKEAQAGDDVDEEPTGATQLELQAMYVQPEMGATALSEIREYNGIFSAQEQPEPHLAIVPETITIEPSPNLQHIPFKYANDAMRPKQDVAMRMEPLPEFKQYSTYNTTTNTLEDVQGLQAMDVVIRAQEQYGLIPIMYRGDAPLILHKDKILGEITPVMKPNYDSAQACFGLDNDEGILEMTLSPQQKSDTLPVEKGGKPKNEEDLAKLKIDLSQCINNEDDAKPLKESRPEIYEELVQILCEEHEALSRDSRVPRLSDLMVVDIPTGDNKPIAQQPYSVPYRYREAVKAEVQKLSAAGLVSPCISAWASPVLVVVKKDSEKIDPKTGEKGEIKLKLATDLRKVNAATDADVGTIADITELVDQFNGKQHFSVMDLASGYYAFAINKPDRHKMNFCLPLSVGGNSYAWNRCPYGLATLPARYSRAIAFLLRGIDGVQSYIDDCSVGTETLEEHLKALRRMLRRFRLARIQINPGKTDLLRKRLELLGIEVTKRGLHMKNRTREKLMEVPMPTTVSEVKTFLGGVGFFRRWLPELAIIAKPFTDLQRKECVDPEKELKGERCRRAHENINLLLSSDRIVYAPQFGDQAGRYHLFTDASKAGIGAVLLQEQTDKEGNIRPVVIGYYSKVFTNKMQEWATFDQECFAVLASIRHWRRYLFGNDFTVFTDSKVASHLMTKVHDPDKTQKLMRWATQIQEYMPFDIGFRKGIDNGGADLLSRKGGFGEYKYVAKDAAEMPPKIYDYLYSIDMPTHAGIKRSALYEVRAPEYRSKLDEIRRTCASDEVIAQLSEESSVDREEVEDILEAMAIDTYESLLCPQSKFDQEADQFERIAAHWKRYVDIFKATTGRRPLVLDCFGGEGGWSLGALAQDIDVIIVENDAKKIPQLQELQKKYPDRVTIIEGNMNDEKTWQNELVDAIHGSPPCHLHTKMGRWDSSHKLAIKYDEEAITILPKFCRNVERYSQKTYKERGTFIPYEIENVTNAKDMIEWSTGRPLHSNLYCGTHFGHKVFKHRVFSCNFLAPHEMKCKHEGKLVGDRGLAPSIQRVRKSSGGDPWEDLPHDARSNMSTVCGKPSTHKGNTLDRWESDMGHEIGSFTARGIAQALPLGYGRYSSMLLIAEHLHQNYGVPLYNYAQARDDPMIQELLQEWSMYGYHPQHDPRISYGGANGTSQEFEFAIDEDNTITQAVEQDRQNSSLMVPTKDAEAKTMAPLPDDNPLRGITREDQRADPFVEHIYTVLKDTTTPTAKREKERSTTLKGYFRLKIIRVSGVDQELVMRRVSIRNQEHEMPYVPEPRRIGILHYFHTSVIYGGHRSHRPLYDIVRNKYWWPGLYDDCRDFCERCSICRELGQRRRLITGKTPNVESGSSRTPSRPFTELAMDIKGPLKRTAAGNIYILIVCCLFTGFLVAVPLPNTESITIARALVDFVFSVHGACYVLKSDNARYFTSEVMQKLGELYGYYNIASLPYNPRGNLMSEVNVKRIAHLLARFCAGMNEWDKPLRPLVHALNCTINEDRGHSAFKLVFGREPIGPAELAWPDISREELRPGEEWVDTLADSLYLAWKHAYENVEEAKKFRAKARLAAHPPDIRPIPLKTNDYVYLEEGDDDTSRRLGKAGLPRRRLLRVIEVDATRGYARLDTTSHPQITPVQSLRKLSRAPQWMTYRERSVLPPLQAELDKLAVDRKDSEVHSLPAPTSRLTTTTLQRDLDKKAKTLSPSTEKMDPIAFPSQVPTNTAKLISVDALHDARTARKEARALKLSTTASKSADGNALRLQNVDDGEVPEVLAYLQPHLDIIHRTTDQTWNAIAARENIKGPSKRHKEFIMNVLTADDIHGTTGEFDTPGISMQMLLELGAKAH